MISAPDLESTRSCLADWFELCAIFSQHGSGRSDIASVARLESNDDRELQRDDGELLEAGILEIDLEENLDRVAEEIDFRRHAMNGMYPFEATREPFRLTLRREVEKLNDAGCVYLFLLILSAARDGHLPQSEALKKLVAEGRVLFHACASIGVAGLLENGKAVWFGFPRPDKTAYLTALAELCKKLGCGRAKEDVPPGLSRSPKDEQVDVVGWRGFRDKRNGNLLVLCQAATGRDWTDKSILPRVGGFRFWFEQEPYALAAGAIAIPFPAHHEVHEHEHGFAQSRHNAMHLAHMTLGVLIDRVRIVESVHDILESGRSLDGIDGISHLPKLREWVGQAVSAIKVA